MSSRASLRPPVRDVGFERRGRAAQRASAASFPRSPCSNAAFASRKSASLRCRPVARGGEKPGLPAGMPPGKDRGAKGNASETLDSRLEPASQDSPIRRTFRPCCLQKGPARRIPRMLKSTLRKRTIAPGGRMAQRKAAPLVGVVMGSDSDWEVMRHAVGAARRVRHPLRAARPVGAPDARRHVRIRRGCGAARPARDHRRRRRRGPPARHARREDDGAGAGRAGAVEIPAAARIRCYSIVQMPKGIPVATFAIGEAGAANAAPVCGRDARRRPIPALAKKLAGVSREADQRRARRCACRT